MTFNFLKRGQEEIDVSALSAKHAKPKKLLYFDPEQEFKEIDFGSMQSVFLNMWMAGNLRKEVELFPLVLKLFFAEELSWFLSHCGEDVISSWDARFNEPAGRHLRAIPRYVFRSAALKEYLFPGRGLLPEQKVRELRVGHGNTLTLEGVLAYGFYHQISGQGEDIDFSSMADELSARMRILYQSGNFVRFADFYMLVKMVYPKCLEEFSFDPQPMRDLYLQRKASISEGSQQDLLDMALLGGALYMMSVDQVLVTKGKITGVKNAAEPIERVSLPLANRLKEAADY